MEKEIVFVTHNTGKIKSAEKYFKNLKFTTFNYELNEPRSDDIKEIATAKVNNVASSSRQVNSNCMTLHFEVSSINKIPRKQKKKTRTTAVI